jgi:hypothetical protein
MHKASQLAVFFKLLLTPLKKCNLGVFTDSSPGLLTFVANPAQEMQPWRIY